MAVDLSALIVGQLEFYWAMHLRPRLEGLTDDEYLWEPVPGCWSLHVDDGGRWQLDTAWPQRPPEVPPVTTIAWRMMHVGALCLANRASAFFGDGSVPADATMFDWRHVPTELPGTAAAAVEFMDWAYAWWHDGIATLDEAGLAARLGRKGAEFADDTMAGLIVHLNREVMHHGGEIGVLRDLYRAGLR